MVRKRGGKMVVLIIALCLIFAAVVLYLAYFFTFRVTERLTATPHTIPPSEQYTPYIKQIHENVDFLLSLEYESVSIKSFDGLNLHAKYYNLREGAPIVMMFHGYRSNGFRDANGGFRICVQKGYNVLIVDQRAHGKSGGKALTFGIKERFDVKEWVKWAQDRFGKTPIALIGVSMGATSVLLASELQLPDTVKAIIADCSFTCPADIIKKVIKQMRLPVSVLFPVVWLSARIFANIDICSVSTTKAVQNTNIPILYIHGDDDRFVPCEMSRLAHKHTKSPTQIVIVKGAAHGMSYYYDTDLYKTSVCEFLEKYIENRGNEND